MLERLKNLLLQNRGVKQTVIKNFFWLVTGQLGTRLFRGIILIYAARVLGAAGYGVFSYALGLSGFFTAFADLGITQIATREASKNPERRSEYFSTSFWMKLTLLIVCAVAILIFAPHISNISAAVALMPLIAILTVTDGFRDFSLFYFRSQEKMEIEAGIMGVTNFSILILGFIALRLSSAPQVFTYAYVISSALGALFSAFILRHEFKTILDHFNKTLVKPIIRVALPIAFSSLFGAFMLNADYVILGWMRTATEIGYYSAAQKIIQILYLLPSLMATGIFPTISRLSKSGDHEKIKSISEKSMAAILLAGIPITIGGIVLAAPIIALIYGSQYLPAVLSFQILLPTVVSVFMGSILSNILFAYDKQKETAVYVGIAAFTNVVLDILLAPQFGIYGVSFGTLVVQAIYITLMLRLTKKVNHIRIFPHLKKITAAAIVMGLASFLLNAAGWNVIVNIIVSIGVYGAALFLLKENMVKELKQLVGAIF